MTKAKLQMQIEELFFQADFAEQMPMLYPQRNAYLFHQASCTSEMLDMHKCYTMGRPYHLSDVQRKK